MKSTPTRKAVVTIPHGHVATVHLISDGLIDEVDVIQDGKVTKTIKRGRPKTILDMRAYKADKAKEYRAKKKAK